MLAHVFRGQMFVFRKRLQESAQTGVDPIRAVRIDWAAVVKIYLVHAIERVLGVLGRPQIVVREVGEEGRYAILARAGMAGRRGPGRGAPFLVALDGLARVHRPAARPPERPIEALRHLLEPQSAVVIGASADGMNPGKGYIRVAMVAEEQEMARGLNRLRDCLYG